MFTQARNTLARAVVRYNKQRELYRVLVAFNVVERTEGGQWRFPQQSRCAFVSGDITFRDLKRDLPRILAQAQSRLRTDAIELVD